VAANTTQTPEDAMLAAWRVCEKQTYDQCHRFRRQYGDALGDVQEVLAWGRYGFVVAYRRYDPACGAAFKTWCYQIVRGTLLDLLRRAAAKHRRHPHASLTGVDVPDRGHFSPAAFAAGLGADAAALAAAVIETPADIALALGAAGGAKPRAEHWRDALFEIFTDMGWSARRFLRAFDEVSEAVGD
jgi:DNA-directed RNA polymerase specialized sigma24 family protein